MDNPSLRGKAWSAYDTRETAGIASAIGDQYINDGRSSVIVAFGADVQDLSKVPSKDPSKIAQWLGKLEPELEGWHQKSVRLLIHPQRKSAPMLRCRSLIRCGMNGWRIPG